MGVDHSLAFRRAVVTHLNNDAPLGALISKAYGPSVPDGAALPFCRMGLIQADTFEATCLDGMESNFDVHAFAKGSDESGCSTIAEAVRAALDDASLTFSGAHTVSLDWVRTNMLRDPSEADLWHGVITFAVTTSDDF